MKVLGGFSGTPKGGESIQSAEAMAASQSRVIRRGLIM